MKGSTLHRSGLTKEKMGVLASLTQPEKKNTRAQLTQYYRATKSKELDMLWENSNSKSVQRVRNVAKAPAQKSPMVYLIIGFIAGVLTMCVITLLVSIFSMSPSTNDSLKNSNVEMVSEDLNAPAVASVEDRTEKYIVKQGDTLNGIAYRFYGKYSEEKINEIQKVNNIKDPASLKIGQELIIPVFKDM